MRLTTVLLCFALATLPTLALAAKGGNSGSTSTTDTSYNPNGKVKGWAKGSTDTSTTSSGSTTTTTTSTDTTSTTTTDTTASTTTGTTTATPTAVSLTWTVPTQRTDGQPLSPSDIVGYEIYLTGDATGTQQVININDGTMTAYQVTDLAADTWHFAISAFDSTGLASDLSNVVSVTLQ